MMNSISIYDVQIFLCVILTSCLGFLPAKGHLAIDAQFTSRPDHTEYAKMARWLVHLNTWGTISTTSRHLNGAPYGNIVSLSDGPVNNSTGRLIFYLTTMDATAYDAQENPSASLALAESQVLGSCKDTDPEDPTCAKLTISGFLGPVPEEEVPSAEEIMFSRHPAMAKWPAGHQFQLYELQIKTMRLLDFYGGAKDITAEEYFIADDSQRPIA